MYVCMYVYPFAKPKSPLINITSSHIPHLQHITPLNFLL